MNAANSNHMISQPVSLDRPVRVLLVDDDEDAQLLISHLLAKVSGRKFELKWSGTYEEGLEKICDNQNDVYLLDYRLGARTGLDLLKEAVACGVNAPFILLTAGADPRVDLEATKAGAADFLIKDKLDSTSLERSIRFSIQHFETLRALQKSNERFRLLFERSMDAILISDDQGRFLEVNGAACSLLAMTREQLLELKLAGLLRKNARSQVTPPRNSAEPTFGELSFAQPDGDTRYVEFSVFRFAPNLNLTILRDITDRRALEQEIQEISEKEQRRLGQDLHDGLGQTLTGIGCLAKVLHQKLASRKASEAPDAANIANFMNQALAQTRELARGLCPVVLDRNDIYAALKQLSDNLENFFKVASEVKFDPTIRITDNAVATHLYRIAQEATTNAIKHGQAKTIRISLVRERGVIVLRIADDGVGLPKDYTKGKGMGTRVMQHRARMIGGTVELERASAGGVVVTCSFENKSQANRSDNEDSLEGPRPAPRKSRTPAKTVRTTSRSSQPVRA